jgi:hypothetical protein
LYHVDEHHHVAQSLAVGDFNDALRQTRALAQHTFCQANAPASDDVVTGLFQASEILTVFVQLALPV